MVSHVTVSGVWEGREKVSHVTVSGVWEGREKVSHVISSAILGMIEPWPECQQN